MSRSTQHDSPYRDAHSHSAAVAAPARPPKGRPARTSPTSPAATARSNKPARDASSPAEPRPRRSRSRGSARRNGGGGGTVAAATQLTSHPTHRGAYIETRAWLLAEHGPVCAYCGRRFKSADMTLDHVAPRRGRTAYDRRDNLVLACPGCNAAKRDLAPIAFLLANRSRAMNLLRYGAHLSPMLVDLARSLLPPSISLPKRLRTIDLDDLDGESPYRD